MGAYAIPLVFSVFKHTNAGHIITTHKQRFGHVNATNIITQVKKTKRTKIQTFTWGFRLIKVTSSIVQISKLQASFQGLQHIVSWGPFGRPVGHPPQKERCSGQTQEVHYYYYYTGRGSLIGVLHEVEWQIVTATMQQNPGSFDILAPANPELNWFLAVKTSVVAITKQ